MENTNLVDAEVLHGLFLELTLNHPLVHHRHLLDELSNCVQTAKTKKVMNYLIISNISNGTNSVFVMQEL